MATASTNHPVKKEEQHCEFSCPAAVIAQIPWLERRNEKAIPFSKCAFYLFHISDLGKKSNTRKKTKIKIHHTVAETFPFFLPARYHAMDSVKIQKNATSPGSYWTNAIHFVHTCSDYSTIPIHDLRVEIALTEPPRDACSISSSQCKFKNFQRGGPEQCKTSAEFLFEPWVILQLPFQPAILHQWTVAALSEHLQYARKLVEIGTIGYLPKFKDLFEEMVSLGENLAKNCNTLLVCFFSNFCERPEESLKTKISMFYVAFEDLLSETLALLEFVQSQDCIDIFKSIEIESLSRNSSPCSLLVSNLLANLMCYKYSGANTCYYYDYWLTFEKCKASSLCTLADGAKVRKYDELALRPEIFARVHPKYCKPSKEQMELGARHAATIIQCNIMANLKNTGEFIANLQQYMGADDYTKFIFHVENLDVFRAMQYMQPVDRGGVLHDIMCLEAAVKAQECLSIMCNLIWRAAEKFSNYRLVAGATAESEFTIPGLMDKIKTARSRKAQWQQSFLFENAHAEVANDNCKFVPTDSLNMMLKKLMIRVRRLVLKMLNTQHVSAGRADLKYYPESHTVQYILPCFITMIIDVHNDRQLDPKAKEDYKRLVDALIRTFEDSMCCQKLSNNRKQYFAGWENFETHCNASFDKLILALTTVFEKSSHLLQIVAKFKDTWKTFAETVPLVEPMLGDILTQTFDKLYKPSNLKIQLSWLCARFQFSSVKSECFHTSRPEFELFDLMAILNSIESDLQKNGNSVSMISQACSKIKRFVSESSRSEILPVTEKLTGLSVYQFQALIAFHLWQLNIRKEEFFATFQNPLFAMDFAQQIMLALLDRDWWKFKSNIAHLTKGSTCEDLGLIPIEEALHNDLCKQPLKLLNAGRKRVKMSQPGEITFCPIKHCRLCGELYGNPFRLCRECKDEPGFPYPNYFCSAKCESIALDKFHTEEHANFVMENLGL